MTAVTDPDCVFERVQACLDSVVGGSGHLASYRLDRKSFAILERRRLGDDHTEYEFVVDGWRHSEFDHAPSGDHATDPVEEPEAERLEGAIVLDDDGGLVTDDSGRVRLRPWRTLDPTHWSTGDDGIEAILDDLDSDGE